MAAPKVRAREGQPPDGQEPAAAAELAIEPFRRAYASALRELFRPAGGVVFVSGSPNPSRIVAETVRDNPTQVPMLVVPSAGVLTAAGEVEGALAASGMVWSAGKVRVAVGDSAREVGKQLGEGGVVVAFWAVDGFEPTEVGALARDRERVFGAGCPGPAVHAVEDGRIRSGRIAALRFEGGSSPIVEASSACRLVGEPMTVTEVERGMVLKLDDQPALDMLTARTGGGRQSGLVLLALHDFGDPDRYLVRPIRGIDPGRKAIAVAADLNVGDPVSFAVRDPAIAREALGEATRKIERQAVGSQPTFGLYLSCAGRGRSLYGESDVDLRILKKRFPGIPLAGMHAAFEVVPWGTGSSKMQLMNGVFALFRAAS